MTPALPWLEAPLQEALRTMQGHAVLVHGPRGVGQLDLALSLAAAWLCESDGVRPCGHCASCRLIAARTHPDLLVLLPEALRESLGWVADDDASPREGKAKPSKDIRVEEVRRAIAFAQTTSARGRAKVLVLHPAERMNAIAANALLKTLEEPPGAARLVLSTAAPDRLLPTIRSRCQAFELALPDEAQAVAWLEAQQVNGAPTLLRACGGRPQEVVEVFGEGVDAATWQRLPSIVARGEAHLVAGWPAPRLVEALQKLCHDAMCVAVGAPPRYFPTDALRGKAPLDALIRWSRALADVSRHAEHPWNAALLTESLVDQGRRALAPVHSNR